ncbi:MAG: hypothetical protein Q9159_002118 [Coniocarpon cinnabarinum]
MSSTLSFDPRDLFAVKDLVAVITGGGTGIGLTFARALAANGAKSVYILGRRLQVLEEAAASDSHSCIHPLQCDVLSKESLSSCADAVREREGHIDILVANAGVSPSECVAGLPPGGRPENAKTFAKAMWDVPIEKFNEPLQVNVTGVFYTVLAFLPLLDEGMSKRDEMLKQTREDSVDAPAPPPRPQILITSSIAGFSRLPTGYLAYSASKAGVTHLAKQLATYLAPFRIRVNVFAPGMFESEMTADRAGPDMFIEGKVKSDKIPAERWASKHDIAGVALYLLGKAGDYLNGAIILLDGGRISIAPATY